jgi:hypothetical protein
MSENLQAENERLSAELARVNKLRAELTRTVDQLADEISGSKRSSIAAGRLLERKNPMNRNSRAMGSVVIRRASGQRAARFTRRCRRRSARQNGTKPATIRALPTANCIVIEIMPDIDKLQEKAAELGCSFEKGATRFAGYVLTDSDGNKPLGDTYTASLKDIERWLDNRLADAGEDVEEDDDDKGKLPVQPPNGPPMKPPTTKKTNQVLKEHSNKDEIKRALDDQPHLTRDQLKDRMRRDIAIIQTPGIRAATSDPLLAIFEDVDGCISKEDRDRLDAFSGASR